MRLVIVVALALATLLGPTATRAWNEEKAEHQPAPEPYSFSYSAESTGGFSSRQETGDGTGRVEGFYIIMGDDQRERRVDYVADKDGYRASISTNEVGTRSQSSADAQYQARLPSQGQLEQAKITLDEYKFLEEQHEFERTRPLNQNNQQAFQSFNRKQSQSQSQEEQTSQQLPGAAQRWSTSSGGSRQSGQAAITTADWQQQQRGASSLSPAANANSASQFEQAFNSNNQTATSATANAQDDENWRSAKLLATGAQQASVQQQRPRGAISSSSLTAANTETEAGPVFSSGARSQGSTQQANLPAWRATSGQSGGAQTSGRLVGAMTNDFGRQQYNQQFMQQASQLAAQDYPRQLQQQQQQEVSTSQQVDQNGGQQQQVVVGQQAARQQPQTNQWQSQQVATGDNVARGQETYSQLSQQQNNVIDEVSGEQVDLGQQVGGQAPVSESPSTTSAPQPTETVEPVRASQFVPRPVQPQVEQQQFQQQQFQQQSRQTYEPQTPTRQPVAPSGFLAIDLGRQEAELSPEAPNTNLQTSTASQQQVEGEQLVVDVEKQRQEAQFRQPQQQPESIQQVIREGALRQQVALTRPTTQQPTTTFRAKLVPETSVAFQPTTTTTTTPRAPVETTIATAAKTTSVGQIGFSTLVLEQPTRKPTLSRQQAQQAQFSSKGVKGGAKWIEQQQRVTTTTTLSTEQPQVVSEIPRIPTGPAKADDYERTKSTYQQSEQVVPEHPTTQQAPGYNVREQQQQLELVTRERVTPTTSTTARPVQFETTLKASPVVQSQPKQWAGGVKGGASKGSNRRQFWQATGAGAAASGNKLASSSAVQRSVSIRVGDQAGQASVDYSSGQQFGSRVQARSQGSV